MIPAETFLLAAQRQVGGVHVEHDLGGCAGVGLDEHFHQHWFKEVPKSLNYYMVKVIRK